MNMQTGVVWAISPRFDGVFLLASLLLPFFFYGLYQTMTPWVHNHLPLQPELFFFVLFTGLFDAPHIFQTFFRTHGDAKVYRRNAWFFNLSLVLALVVTFCFYSLGEREIFIAFLGFFGGWHIVRQNIGFLRVYQSKEDRNLQNFHLSERRFVYFTWIYFLFREVNSRSEWLPSTWKDLSLFATLNTLTTWVWLGLFLLLLLRQVRKPSSPREWPKTVFLYGQSLSFFILAHLQTPFLIMVALATITHAWQYHGWINHYYKKRELGTRWVHLGFYGTWLLGLLLLLDGLGFQAEAFDLQILSLAAIYNGFVLWHYFIDGFIWRFRSQPELKQLL